MKKFENEIENILEMEGVNAEGFGLIAQAFMFDKDVPAPSKAIYAYFCSHLGAGRTIFPKVSTVMYDLKMAKNTFYKYFNALVERGYIKVSKAKGFLNKNVYTICNNVPKLKVPVFSSDKEQSQLALDGINASGYGFIPKLAMKDRRLSTKAKALLAFLYSLAQNDGCAFPHRTTICTFLNISKDVYYNALNELIETNYITVHQRKHKNGQFSVNDYILNSNPKIEQKPGEPCPENCDNGENGLNSEFSPCPSFCDNGENGLNSEVSPCPDFCDNGEVNRVGIFETLPCPENCDVITVPDISLPISNKISSNLKVEKLPYTENVEVIREEIQKLTWSGYVKQDKQIKSEVKATYLKAVAALIEMLYEEKAIYNREVVTREKLFFFLNNCIEDDADCYEPDENGVIKTVDGFTVAYSYSLRILLFCIVENFNRAIKMRHIRNPKSYLKSIIWDNIKNYF